MKKRHLFLITLCVMSLLVFAEMTVYVHKKDGTKVPYVAATVDSIGFVNVYTITFDANGGEGSMDAIIIKEGETITLPSNTIVNFKADFNGWNTKIDGSGTNYSDKSNITPLGDVILYAQWQNVKTEGEENGHEWVDLGLPSGTLWATTNLGASEPEAYGDYYKYGDSGSGNSLENYKWYNSEYKKYTKYCKYDKRFILELADDFARKKWGGNWRTPTKMEFEELINNSFVEWINFNGTTGYRYTSKINGNIIFLPAAGVPDGYDFDKGKYGYYGTSSAYEGPFPSYSDGGNSYGLSFSSTSHQIRLTNVYASSSIRPVIGKKSHKVTFNKNIGDIEDFSFQVAHAGELRANVQLYVQEGYDFCGWNTKSDGSGIYVESSEIMYIYQDTTLYAQWSKKIIEDKNDYVDLGLPSGVLWATCNLGAEKPEVRGSFYAWAEVEPKAIYNQDTYKWKMIVISGNAIRCLYSKYCTSNGDNGTYDDSRMELDNIDDAAYYNMGSEWRMPTKDEFDELKNSCLWEWTTINGVNGYNITSKKNGNSIFLPASGFRTDNLLEGNNECGCYYTSVRKIHKNTPYTLKFSSNEINVEETKERFNGYSIRPVRVK